MGKKWILALGCSLVLATGGCAGYAPVPGGDATTNKNFYESDIDMKARLATLETGMSRAEVFERLGRKEEDFITLERESIIQALLGGSDASISSMLDGWETEWEFIQSLSGYRLNFKVVGREHGLDSPIGMRTDETGFSYSAVLVFRHDQLFEKPIVSGGIVHTTTSKTIFDYLSPSTFAKSF